MAEAPNQDDARVLHDVQINMALGAFLVFFGLVVLVSIFFTDTGIGKLTNLGAGVVIGRSRDDLQGPAPQETAVTTCANFERRRHHAVILNAAQRSEA